MNLIELKNKIEGLTKYHQIEILRILYNDKDKNIILNENKNGIFVNLTDLNENVIKKIIKYIEYVDEQQIELNEIETKKQYIEENFFNE